MHIKGSIQSIFKVWRIFPSDNNSELSRGVAMAVMVDKLRTLAPEVEISLFLGIWWSKDSPYEPKALVTLKEGWTPHDAEE